MIKIILILFKNRKIINNNIWAMKKVVTDNLL